MTVKKTFVCDINCPWCSQKINIIKETNVIQPAQKAEKEEKFLAEKGVQTTLS